MATEEKGFGVGRLVERGGKEKLLYQAYLHLNLGIVRGMAAYIPCTHKLKL
jgi:hypothetical protein